MRIGEIAALCVGDVLNARGEVRLPTDFQQLQDLKMLGS
jgi:hypothetical protein